MSGHKKNGTQVRYIAFPEPYPQWPQEYGIATGVGWMCLVAAELFGVSNYGLGQKYGFSIPHQWIALSYTYPPWHKSAGVDMVFRYYVDRHFLTVANGEVA